MPGFPVDGHICGTNKVFKVDSDGCEQKTKQN